MTLPELLRSCCPLIPVLVPTIVLAQAYNYPNGSTVADFSVTATDGTVYDLYDLNDQGKYVFLDFFMLWCIPCQETGPGWAELYQTYGCNTGDVVCLSLDMEANSNEEVLAFGEAFLGEGPHPPVATGALVLSDIFGITNAPNYCLIGPDHVMIETRIWPDSSMADLAAALPGESGISPQSCVLGIDNGTGSGHSVYPSPTAGTVRLKDPEVARVRVRDVSGRVVDEVPVIRGEAVLPGSVPGLLILEHLNARGGIRGTSRVVLE